MVLTMDVCFCRAAKRHTDEKSFFGGQLHVCYAPEYESVEETRQKLQDRRRYVNRTTQKAGIWLVGWLLIELCNNILNIRHIVGYNCVVFTAKQHDQPQDESTEIPETDTPTAAAPEAQKHFKNVRENVNSDFPYPPLPSKKELPHSCHNFQQPLQIPRMERLPTEDKMGSLHHYIPPVLDTLKHFTPCLSSSNKDRDLKNLSASVRFMPRIAHLESRKRKSEDLLFSKEMDKDGPIIGPKLPEMPKLDMEDKSLNVTANLIRQTMTKVCI